MAAALLGVSCAAPRPAVDPARLAELERENRHLEEQLHAVRVDIAHLLCVQARVLRVEDDVVLLDRGTADEVVVGVEFSVLDGRSFKGLVEVTKVFEHSCKARPKLLRRPMLAGDLASTAPSVVRLGSPR